MPVFTVDSEQINATAGNVRVSSGRVTTEVQGMYAALQALQDSWHGGASAAFQGVMQNWHATQLRVEESIAQINQALQMAGQQYQDVESSNMRMFAA
ncbi:WXG100 family type VII secretion target [Agrococcus casei]|uniref:ESAT-6-like protein n=1 Tax=Agrococcus casei LMG 22410 TaxID=1255656 RepID=A0A1R4GCM3_9MICO|nr:WXG100 family type VII secretion target [Agrococcus casei]SJM65944.1 Uncharacterized protein conserved in bacteria [Agrococcus casei LMG 22410]